MCPLHGGVSLSLSDGRNGALLAYCFGGCDAREVWQELRDRGLIRIGGDRRSPGRIAEQHKREAAAEKVEQERIRRRIERARALYRRGVDATGTPVETYLRSRNITIAVPRGLRFVQHCPHRNGRYYPAMVAPVVDIDDAMIGVHVDGVQHVDRVHVGGVHKTFLKPDGSGKADLSKEAQRESCGMLKAGAVRLAGLDHDCALIVGEGIESVLSLMQLRHLPGWAALSAPGLLTLALPPEARRVLLAVDHDANGVGQAAAREAADRWLAEGREVRLAMLANHADWNDNLRELCCVS
jgi:hypothetical protein